MGGSSQDENYDDWLWCSFTLEEVLTAKITASKSMAIIDRVIVDDVEQTMENSITQEFGIGQHKILWHLSGGSILQNSVPEVITPNKAKRSIVNIPASVTYIGNFGMRGYPLYAPNRVISRAITPPACDSVLSIGLWSSANFSIYVPDESVNAYKAATGWSQYERWIVGLSTL